jgi:hypothetical protein
VEVQFHSVVSDEGPSARQIFGSNSFWALSLGARVILGGDPMRMGSYGVLDPMTEMTRTDAGAHVH